MKKSPSLPAYNKGLWEQLNLKTNEYIYSYNMQTGSRGMEALEEALKEYMKKKFEKQEEVINVDQALENLLQKTKI